MTTLFNQIALRIDYIWRRNIVSKYCWFVGHDVYADYEDYEGWRYPLAPDMCLRCLHDEYSKDLEEGNLHTALARFKQSISDKWQGREW